jgi:hypothetical protein
MAYNPLAKGLEAPVPAPSAVNNATLPDSPEREWLPVQARPMTG